MRNIFSAAVLIGSLVLTAMFSVVAAHATNTNKDRLIHTFSPAPNGFPESGLTVDAAGNLYGATYGTFGCSNSCGEVFELSPAANGQFQYRVLHTFTRGTGDGIFPQGALVLDAQGNLYGTTIYGGTGGTNCIYGCGTVFELSPTPTGPWTETILYSFKNGFDGFAPNTGVIFDTDGNLYGVTEGGGAGFPDPVGVGTVFELTPVAGGGWSESILHAFVYNSGDGYYPWGIAMDVSGNIWGVTAGGGNCPSGSCGTVYELVRASNWRETIVYDFQGGTGGDEPVSTLVFDSTGNVYGTASIGGVSGGGIVFEMTQSSGGVWTEQILHSFTGTPDGYDPFSGLTFDQARNLYGTTTRGGAPCNCGTVFKMSPAAGGSWTESIVYNFEPTAKDGRLPIGNVIFGPASLLYGVTVDGGPKGAGTVYQVKP
jgi:uncharacterized repeat protein (TIGR03803 family)